MIKDDLGALENPESFHAPVNISGRDAGNLIRMLEDMLRIRRVEQHLAAMRRDRYIGGPVHLGVGQEAVAVAVAASLRKTDCVFGAHRSHSHLLAMGSSIHGLFAEVLGKDTGLSKGMGGSMHLWDQPNGFYGSVPIVAGTVPLAVGAGLACKLRASDSIGVTYFGDGAAEEGVVHESLNLASVFKLPVLFVVENNLFSSHMHISLRQPHSSIARFARAHGIPAEVVDGNDVTATADAAARLVERSRAGGGPGFLEAVTYRWYGHVDWRDDIDVGISRSTRDLELWRARDPVARLRKPLEEAGLLAADALADYDSRLQREIQESWERAMSDPYPPASALLDRVYSRTDGR